LALQPGQVKDATQYADIAMLASRWEGKQVALPVLMESIALIYNRTWVPDPPQSFEELGEIAQGLADTEDERWGLVLPLLSQTHAYPFMDAYGGYIFGCAISVFEGQKCDLGDIGLNNEGAVRGLEFLSDLYLGDSKSSGTREPPEPVLPETLADRETMHDDAVDLFVEGQAAMLLEGPWALSQIKDSGINYGVAAIPDLPEGVHSPRSLTVVHAFAASARSAHPTEATEFLNFLASPEAVVTLYDALGKAPVRRDVLRQPALRQDQELRTWYDQAANGVPLPQEPELGYVWAPWARALDEAVPGLRSAQEALDQAVEQIQGYIEPE
jgi:maltose-binding protein MalE